MRQYKGRIVNIFWRGKKEAQCDRACRYELCDKYTMGASVKNMMILLQCNEDFFTDYLFAAVYDGMRIRMGLFVSPSLAWDGNNRILRA